MRTDTPLLDPSEYHLFPFDGAHVVIRDEVDQLFLLNETAHLIWESLISGNNAQEAAAELSRLYGVPQERTSADVESTLAHWKEKGLIGPRPEKEGPPPTKKGENFPFHAAPTEAYIERHYRMCGVPFTIRYANPWLEINIHLRIGGLETAKVARAPVLTLDIAEGGGYLISGEGEKIAKVKEVWHAEMYACSWIMGTIHTNHRWMVIMHAAAVSQGGEAIVFPASFGSGKSTLSFALAFAQFRYLSDDLFPVGYDGKVYPFPIDIGLKEGSWEVAKRYDEKVESSPGATRTDGVRLLYYPPPGRSLDDPLTPARPKAFVFPRYTPGAQTTLTPITPTEALVLLTDAESKVKPYPEKVGPFLEWLEKIPAYTFVYEDLDEAVGTIERLFEKESR